MIYKRRDYAWLGGVVNQMTKNFLKSKRRRRVKIFHSLQEGWIGNWYLMNYWFAWRGGDIVFEIWIHLQNQLFACGGDFPRGSLQISARWNPLFLLIFLKFCHIHCVEIGSNIVFSHSELWPFLNVELGFAECYHQRYLMLQKSLHNTIQYEILRENQGLLTFYSDSWAQIS